MIENHQHTIVNLNRKNENILVKIEIPNLIQYNHNSNCMILIFLFIIGYIYRSHRWAKWIFYHILYFINIM